MAITQAFLTPPLTSRLQQTSPSIARRNHNNIPARTILLCRNADRSPASASASGDRINNNGVQKQRKPTDWATRTRRPRVAPCNSASEDQIISRIMGCSRRDNWYCAHVAFIQFSNSTTPTARLVGAYVHALSRGGRLETAREVLEAHAHLGGDTAIARASLIAAVAKQYGADAAFNELLATPSHLWSPHACTSVMHAFGVEGVRPHVAVEILESARTRGVVVDRGMYDSAMRALGRAGKVKEAYLLLTSMIKDNISPSDITFEALIYACAHAQTENSNAMLGKRACVVFEAAKEANQVTPRVLSAFASVILRSGIWDDHRAVDLINRMGNVAKLDSEQLRKKGVKFELFESKLYRLRLLREKSLTIALDKSLDKQGHKAAKKQRLRVPNWTQPEKL